jgi:group I intron endonuclease
MKENKTNCGIYRITNLVPDEKTGVCKVYIGSSINLKSRKWHHFNQLNRNRHPNSYLQNAVNKYSIDNFKFEIVKYIEKIENKGELKEVLLKQENRELNNYKKDSGDIDHYKCYNISPIAGSTLGNKHSEKTKEKIRQASTGRKLSKEVKDKIGKSNKISQKGKKVAEETKEKIKTTLKGRIFSEEWKLKISKSKKGHEVTKGTKNKLGKKIKNLTTDKVFNTAKEASLFYGISDKHIGTVCKGKRKTCGGYKWSYYNEGENCADKN